MHPKRRTRLTHPIIQVATKYPVVMFADVQLLADAEGVHSADIIRTAVAQYLELATVQDKIAHLRNQQIPEDSKTPQP